ncbi:MAG TPA: site-2 protease family protein [Isosphaeraceae bacterium]|jgi:Zn-dependent protease
MLGIPASTPFDLRFRVLGFPTRIHPLFWLVTAFLGGLGRDGTTPLEVVLWIACVFVSILVHELGHALVARFHGAWPAIILHGFGGLCVYNEHQPPRQRLAVLFCGPGAGFVLCALTLAVGAAAFRLTAGEALALLGAQVGITGGALRGALKVYSAGEVPATIFWNLIHINFWWGLVNLLPIWPLDGGQMTGEVLKLVDARRPMRRTHIAGMFASGLLAVLVYKLWQDSFLTLFFAYFAFINFQMLQAIHDQSARFGGDESEGWRW